jgi:hypothetical protein
VVADVSSLQCSARKGLAAMSPFGKILRGLKKLRGTESLASEDYLREYCAAP